MNIKDIAELAGVSHTTVSRVINNSQNVKESTRLRVLKVIQEQRFSPNVSAKALNSGKSYTIGLLVFYDFSTFPLGFIPPILLGITNCLNKQGYSLQIFLMALRICWITVLAVWGNSIIWTACWY